MNYNTNMGGVDLVDQSTKYYNMDRRTIKWYKKLFFLLLDFSFHHSYAVDENHKQT